MQGLSVAGMGTWDAEVRERRCRALRFTSCLPACNLALPLPGPRSLLPPAPAHPRAQTPAPPVRSKEAEADAASEPLLSSFLYASILSHDNFERSLAFVLSNRLSDATFLATELFEVFYSILR